MAGNKNAAKRNNQTNKKKKNTQQPRPQRRVRPQRTRPNTESGNSGFFQKLGSTVGKGVDWFAKITGFGDYSVNANTLTMGTSPPTFNKQGKRTTIVRHREYIGDVSGSTGFARQYELPINPGGGSFPYLSTIAGSFEEYRIHGMVFEYKATCATAVASTNTALGTVILATQYDTYDIPFYNKQAMENYEFATSTTPFSDCLHPIECDPKMTGVPQLFTRDGGAVHGDPRLYDLGKFTLATSGMQAVSVVGELWVTYEIELLKAKLPDVQGLYANVLVTSSNVFPGLGVTPTDARPLGSTGRTIADTTGNGHGVQNCNIRSITVEDSPLGGSRVTLTDPRLAGQRLVVTWIVVGGSVTPVLNAANNVVGGGLSYFYNSSSVASLGGFLSNSGSPSVSTAFATCEMFVNASSPFLQFDVPAGTYPTTASESRLLISMAGPFQ